MEALSRMLYYCVNTLSPRLSTSCRFFFFIWKYQPQQKYLCITFISLFFCVAWVNGCCMETNQLWQNYNNPMATAQEEFIPLKTVRHNQWTNPSETVSMTCRAKYYDELVGNFTKGSPQTFFEMTDTLKKMLPFGQVGNFNIFCKCLQLKESPRSVAVHHPFSHAY